VAEKSLKNVKSNMVSASLLSSCRRELLTCWYHTTCL